MGDDVVLTGRNGLAANPGGSSRPEQKDPPGRGGGPRQLRHQGGGHERERRRLPWDGGVVRQSHSLLT